MTRAATDVFTEAERSAVMRAVKSRDTGPEIALRKALFRLGLRYRLDDRRLPGRPDIVFPGPRAAIFVHGCFWHGHECPRGRRRPKANARYWRLKIARNRARDAAAAAALRRLGWRVMIVWECALKEPARVARRLARRIKKKEPDL